MREGFLGETVDFTLSFLPGVYITCLVAPRRKAEIMNGKHHLYTYSVLVACKSSKPFILVDDGALL